MTATRSILARSAVCPHALAAPAATAEPKRNSRRLIICPSHEIGDWVLESIPVVPEYEYSQKTAFRPHRIDSGYPEGLAYSSVSAASYTFVTPEPQPSQAAK